MVQSIPKRWIGFLTSSFETSSLPEKIPENEEDQQPKNPPPNFSLWELEDVAKYLDIDPDYWVFRRFGKLHLFNLLRLQLDLVRLERKLEKYIEASTSADISQNISDREKEKFVNNIHQTLSEYGMSLPVPLPVFLLLPRLINIQLLT
jgi:hypothetical protein